MHCQAHQLSFSRRLGSGSFGEVFMASWMGSEAAVKRVISRPKPSIMNHGPHTDEAAVKLVFRQTLNPKLHLCVVPPKPLQPQ